MRAVFEHVVPGNDPRLSLSGLWAGSYLHLPHHLGKCPEIVPRIRWSIEY